MRGKGHNIADNGSKTRITPAYAGKRRKVKKGQEVYKDHPRLCGEKCNRLHTAINQRGSPPPMRGKVRHFAGK